MVSITEFIKIHISIFPNGFDSIKAAASIIVYLYYIVSLLCCEFRTANTYKKKKNLNRDFSAFANTFRAAVHNSHNIITVIGIW